MKDYGPVLQAEKGPDFSIRITVTAPHGETTVNIPLSGASRLVGVLGQLIGEQADAMNIELQKWINTG